MQFYIQHTIFKPRFLTQIVLMFHFVIFFYYVLLVLLLSFITSLVLRYVVGQTQYKLLFKPVNLLVTLPNINKLHIFRLFLHFEYKFSNFISDMFLLQCGFLFRSYKT